MTNGKRLMEGGKKTGVFSPSSTSLRPERRAGSSGGDRREKIRGEKGDGEKESVDGSSSEEISIGKGGAEGGEGGGQTVLTSFIRTGNFGGEEERGRKEG